MNAEQKFVAKKITVPVNTVRELYQMIAKLKTVQYEARAIFLEDFESERDQQIFCRALKSIDEAQKWLLDISCLND